MILWELKRLIRIRILYSAAAVTAIIWLYTCSVGYFYGMNLSVKASLFWHEIGAVFMGGVVLLGCVPLFTLDYEKDLQDTILSTKKGRRYAALSRFAAALIYCTIFILVSTCISIFPTLIYDFPVLWMDIGFRVMLAMVGIFIYCTFCCGIADLSKSRTMTLTICGLSYAFSFLLYEPPMSDIFFWFLKHGLFSDVVRAHRITTQSDFGLLILTIWYTAFVVLVFGIVIYKRKQRREW